jgi:hypothetical protein
MRHRLIYQHIEVRLVSLCDLDLFEARPTPAGLDEAERLRRAFARSLKMARAGQAAVELLRQQGPYAAEQVARMLDEACRGL